MAKAHPIWSNFSGGEFSPLLEGRVDLAKYFNACRKLQNMLVHPQGPASNRSGFRYIASTKDHNKKSRLISFEFSEEQAYILEFGDQYIRFYMDQGQIVHTLDTVDAWNDSTEYNPYDYVKHNTVIYRCILTHTNQEPPNVTYWIATDIYEIASPYLAADLPKIKIAQSADIMWLVHPDHEPKKLSRTAHTSWTLEDYVPYGNPLDLLLALRCNGENGSNYFPDDAKGHEFTAYGTAQVSTTVKKWGTGSLLLDGDSDYIQAEDSADWDMIEKNTDDWTIHLWVKHADHVGTEYYLQHWQDANNYWRLNHAHGSGLVFYAWSGATTVVNTGFGGEITDSDWHHIAVIKVESKYGIYKDGQQVAYTEDKSTANFSGPLVIGYAVGGASYFNGNIDEILIWKSNIFKAMPKSDNSDTITVPTTEHNPNIFGSEGNYPGCVTFYENRLCFAGTKNNPQTIWMSVPGDYKNLAVGINDDEAVKFSIAADQVNVIKSIVPMSILLLGATGGEWRCGASSPDQPITPTNIYIRRESGYGFADVQARLVGGVCLFLQKARRKIRELTYDYTTGYSSPDMTILAEHITKPQITEMTYQQEPFSIVWCVRSDGVLLGFTYLREHEVMAWHRHTTEGEFESVAVIPGAQEDELWAVVKRTIGETTKRYVELLESPFDDTDTKTAFFVDSGLSYDGEPTSTITGLDHLEGEEVTVLADGATHPNKTVSGNSITLDREASKVHVGLGYTSVLQTMRLEAGVREGTAQGRIKRINKVVIRLYKTLGCKVGPDENTLDTIYFRDSSMPMDTPPDLFTGDKEIDYPEGYETDAHITVVQDLPLPITVVALMPRIRTAEGE